MIVVALCVAIGALLIAVGHGWIVAKRAHPLEVARG